MNSHLCYYAMLYAEVVYVQWRPRSQLDLFYTDKTKKLIKQKKICVCVHVRLRVYVNRQLGNSSPLSGCIPAAYHHHRWLLW